MSLPAVSPWSASCLSCLALPQHPPAQPHVSLVSLSRSIPLIAGLSIGALLLLVLVVLCFLYPGCPLYKRRKKRQQRGEYSGTKEGGGISTQGQRRVEG